MVKKKVDPRVRGLIEHGIKKNHRSLFILVGDHGKDQVENIHRILSKARVKARPSVLWCYKKELGFSTHRKKRIKDIKKQQSRGLYDPDRDDPFDLFISSTNIRWTYYKETDKVLGQTFGMCVLQDFEAITPNVLARTIETVEGGGIVIILLKTVKSLKQLYTLSMDVHSRFRTESHHEVVPRFNERFILSLGDCANCLVLDDELNILPISSKVNYLPTSGSDYENSTDALVADGGEVEDPELSELKGSLVNTPHVGNLVTLSKTLDQAKAIMSFLDAISDRSLRSTVSLTAGRGRGKSAAIGLCLAGSIAFGYSNVFVTAPSPENLKTCFDFVIEGLKALNYAEHLDFEVIHEHIDEIGKVVVRINIFRQHRQTIQYVNPSDHLKLAQAELVAIDEAAAIPLPTVKKLMGPYLVFLSSTINGYEGTGRSLSLKLIQQLRVQQGAAINAAANAAAASVSGNKGGSKKGERKLHEERWKTAANAFIQNSSDASRVLTEITLSVPIRYSSNDPVERWLHQLLCLDVNQNVSRIVSNIPAPKDCELYLVDRDALFSYHPLAENLLQRIWALYTSAHYKNSPNDLQILSDAPAHRLFVLLGPQKSSSSSSSSSLPDVLCIVQVAFEGRISQKSIQTELSKGNKASGDMIPWTVAQQFNDSEFASLSGARVVRIATHPDVQKMGYGSRAMDLLISYFQGELTIQTILPSMQIFGGEGSHNKLNQEAIQRSEEELGQSLSLQDEMIIPRNKLPPLLTPIADRPAERLHWLGVSFGLTNELLNFWNRKGFKVCYLRQTTNELTGEHSCIALKELDTSGIYDNNTPQNGWLGPFIHDYRFRLISLLSYTFQHLSSSMALTLIDPERQFTAAINSNADDDGDDPTSSSTVNNAAVAITNGRGILNVEELVNVHFNHYDMKRLEMYSRNLVDHHMILDLLPIMARLFFQGRLGGQVRVSLLQAAILLAIGLQHRDIDSIGNELDLPSNQILAFFNKTVRKISNHFRRLIELKEEKQLDDKTNQGIKSINNGNNKGIAASVFSATSRIERKSNHDSDVKVSGDDEREEEEDDVRKEQKKLMMSDPDLKKHQIKVSDDHIRSSLGNKKEIPHLVSIIKDKSEVEVVPKVDVDKKTKDKKGKKKRSHDDDADNTTNHYEDDVQPTEKVQKKTKKLKVNSSA